MLYCFNFVFMTILERSWYNQRNAYNYECVHILLKAWRVAFFRVRDRGKGHFESWEIHWYQGMKANKMKILKSTFSVSCQSRCQGQPDNIIHFSYLIELYFNFQFLCEVETIHGVVKASWRSQLRHVAGLVPAHLPVSSHQLGGGFSL